MLWLGNEYRFCRNILADALPLLGPVGRSHRHHCIIVLPPKYLTCAKPDRVRKTPCYLYLLANKRVYTHVQNP